MRALGVLIAIALATPAAAQPAGNKGAAEREYGEGQARYKQGDFIGAADKFKVAFDLDPDPVYLYNAAQAYRFAKMCGASATYYKKFLDTAPAAAPNRDKAERFRDEMDACAKTEPLAAPDRPSPSPLMPISGAPAEPPPEPHDTASHGNRNLTYSLALGGVGIVGLAFGVYFTQKAISAGDDQQQCLHDATPMMACPGARIAHDQQQGNNANLGQKIVYPIGGAAIAGAVVLYVLGRDRGAEHAVTIAPTRNGAMVSWTF